MDFYHTRNLLSCHVEEVGEHFFLFPKVDRHHSCPSSNETFLYILHIVSFIPISTSCSMTSSCRQEMLVFDWMNKENDWRGEAEQCGGLSPDLVKQEWLFSMLSNLWFFYSEMTLLIYTHPTFWDQMLDWEPLHMNFNFFSLKISACAAGHPLIYIITHGHQNRNDHLFSQEKETRKRKTYTITTCWQCWQFSIKKLTTISDPIIQLLHLY